MNDVVIFDPRDPAGAKNLPKCPHPNLAADEATPEQRAEVRAWAKETLRILDARRAERDAKLAEPEGHPKE